MCRESRPSRSEGGDSAGGGWGERPLGEHIAGERLGTSLHFTSLWPVRVRDYGPTKDTG